MGMQRAKANRRIVILDLSDFLASIGLESYKGLAQFVYVMVTQYSNIKKTKENLYLQVGILNFYYQSIRKDQISRPLQSLISAKQSTYFMQESNINISTENIIEAFNVISNPTNSSENITAANQYLNDCQKSPKFALVLINLYSSSSQQFVQLQSLLLLLNIIKRNWQSKRGRGKPQDMQSFQNQKPLLRKQILTVYPLFNLAYVKHFNQILKFLARQDYPAKYIELHEFILSSLNNLLQVLETQCLQQKKNIIVGLLSTVKIIIKQFASKRLSHSQQLFTNYISELVKISFMISSKLHGLISNINLEQPSIELIQTLLQSAKKVDKIILYSLQSMPNSLQYVSQVQAIFQTILNHASNFDSLIVDSLQNKQNILPYFQSYLSGVLEQIFKIQTLYPFLLSNFLESYLHLILKMLVTNIPNKTYKNERLIINVVQANLKIFTCFTYYMGQQEFSGSIYNRKNTSNIDLQSKCHQQFINVFSTQNVTQFLSKLITEVMVSKSINSTQKDIVDQQMVLEQNQVASQDSLSDSNAYQMCILLCKNIVKCFKNQVKGVLQGLFLSVGNFQTSNNSLKQRIIQNSMQLILILPKIYDQHELPLQHVMNLLSALYANNQFSMLARLIKNYHEYLNQSTLQNSFSILSQIVATPITNQHINIDIIYQSALTMKKILTQNESDIFSFQNFSKCIINLLSLLQNDKFTKTPTLMWPLIKLSNQLLKLTNQNVIIGQIGEKILDCVYPIIQNKHIEELTVFGIAQTIQNLLNIICACFKNNYLSQDLNTVAINKSTVKALYGAYTLVINHLDNKNLENVDSLYMLWLCLVRNYPTLGQQSLYQLNGLAQFSNLNTHMQELFTHAFDTVMEEDSICAIQILEEYVVIGLISLSQNQLLAIFEKLLSNCLQEHKVRTYTALFSMYYCYLIVQTQNGKQNALQRDILKLILDTLIQYFNLISPQINGLRTLLMIIVNYCIVKFGVQNIYELFNSFCSGNYSKWFYPYCWSSQFVSNRLCHKINSTAYLKAIQQIGSVTFGKMLQTPIDQQYPLDTVLKTMIICLQPIKLSQGYYTLSNMYKLILPTESSASSMNSSTSRKIKLQLSGLIRQILVNDQRENYQTLINQLLQSWNWAEDDIVERFDKITSNEIINLLKGNFKKDYDINQPD